MRRPLRAGVALLLVLLGPGAAPLAAAAGSSGKKILVLYKQRDADHGNAVSYLGAFLKQAGYEWEAKDVESFFPSGPDMSRYRGIVTSYLSSQMVGADAYPEWMVKQLEAGRKVAIVGSYGAYQGLIPKPNGKFIQWNESMRTINTFLWPFGIEFYFAFTDDSSKLEVGRKDRRFAEFEAPLEAADLRYYQLFRSANPRNKIHLLVRRKDMMDSDSVFIAHTPFGGMILEGYGFFWDEKKKAMIQRVDMAGFFKECFERPPPRVRHYDLPSHKELVDRRPLPQVPPPTDPEPAHPEEALRRVLVVYKKSEAPNLEHHPFYNRADIVLTALGVVVDYHAVEDGLPSDARMRRYRGIVTWNVTPAMTRAEAYGDWLIRQIRRGRRVVLLQDYGASIDKDEQTPAANVGAVFEALGIAFGPLGLARFEKFPSVRVLDKAMIGFERMTEPEDIQYGHRYVSRDPRNRVYLSFTDPASGPIDLVVTTPAGGVAMERSPFYFPPVDSARIALVRSALAKRLQPELAEEKTLGSWIIDPYRFFSEALALGPLPAPDYTTMNGARLFYAHIDGDALDSVSLIDKAHFAGQFITEEILKAYPRVPQSVSVISQFVQNYGTRTYQPLVELARAIFRLPHIEVASHAATHPFDWVGGDPAVSNPGEFPWKIVYRPQDFLNEIWGSRLFINENLAPPGKSCDTLFWSGATNPDARALEVAWRAGMHNLNGGDPIFDREHPSLAGLSPVATPVGPYRQYHTSAQNDYLYTLFLTGDWAGQKKVLDHFAHTESPRRILPMNLYYHFYSGIKRESLEALKFILDRVVAMEPAMVFASQYCRIAEDFYRTVLWREGPAWRVKNAGDLREIRFPGQTAVDLAASEGVVGFSHFQGQTYVHLDGRPERKIVLTGRPASTPYVERCTYWIDKALPSAERLGLRVRGLGRFSAVFGGLGTGAWRLTLTDGAGVRRLDAPLRGDSQGRAEYRLDLAPPEASYRLILSRR